MSARRALISVTDKTGIAEFASGLAKLGFEIVSTGGTAGALRSAGFTVTDVADVTRFPEMLGGRVKTLHPAIHGGILGDVRLPDHREQMTAAGIEPFHVVCVNLYAFEKTVLGPHDEAAAIESIDIGGPALIRAAAKNYANVFVVVDSADFASVLGAMSDKSDVADRSDLRKRLAAKAFRHTAFYDSMIARYLTTELFPETFTLGLWQRQVFRYGENPHQAGALYADPLSKPGIASATQLWGKELSYNNVLDADAAWGLACDIPPGSCVIVKHGNPCGTARGSDLADSYRLARASDPISAFGGIAAFHGPLDANAASAMTEKGNFLEVVIATEFAPEALAIFKERSGWGQDVRLIAAPIQSSHQSLTIRSVGGGTVIQQADSEPESALWQVATKRQPTDAQAASLRFLWTVVRHVKSNAIVIGDGNRLLGVGAGQMNRVQSVRLAIEQAGAACQGAALASDAFFPFPDSIETAAEAGIAAIVQPGGSKKDSEVIAAADANGIAMVLTGVRHFRH